MITLRKIFNNTIFRVITNSEERFQEISKSILDFGIEPYSIELSKAIMIPENPSLGCNTSQINAMENYPDEEFLCIIEDDVEFNSDFSKDILDLEINNRIIPNCSVIYLGISGWGYTVEGSKLNGVVYDKSLINPDIFVRVRNMFSTHAILHMNSDYTKNLRETVISKTFPNYIEPNDFSNARSQKDNLCLALRIPMFYQKGIHEYCTKISFNEER